MEIFNEILKVNDETGNAWFELRDLLKILGYSNLDKAIANMKIST
jgi:prophage antirepressor-like protein